MKLHVSLAISREFCDKMMGYRYIVRDTHHIYNINLSLYRVPIHTLSYFKKLYIIITFSHMLYSYVCTRLYYIADLKVFEDGVKENQWRIHMCGEDFIY